MASFFAAMQMAVLRARSVWRTHLAHHLLSFYIESSRNVVLATLLISSLTVVFVVQAFVEFTNEETAARAMQLHREPMGSVCCFAQKQLHIC